MTVDSPDGLGQRLGAGLELRADYEATQRLWSQLVETRFRLLALAPIVTAFGVARTLPPAVAVLGVAATAGVIVYEMRNSQLHDNAVHRLRWLERQRELPSSVSAAGHGGAVTDARSGRPLRTVGGLRIAHDRALALVYGGVAGAWVWRLVSAVASQWWSGRAVTWPAGGAGAATALGTLATIIRAAGRARVSEPVDPRSPLLRKAPRRSARPSA